MKQRHKLREIKDVMVALVRPDRLRIFFLLMVFLLVMWFDNGNMFSFVSKYDLSLHSYGHLFKASYSHVPSSILVSQHHLCS